MDTTPNYFKGKNMHSNMDTEFVFPEEGDSILTKVCIYNHGSCDNY